MQHCARPPRACALHAAGLDPALEARAASYEDALAAAEATRAAVDEASAADAAKWTKALDEYSLKSEAYGEAKLRVLRAERALMDAEEAVEEHMKRCSRSTISSHQGA